MTRLSLAVGIVVGSVGYRVHRAKEQGDAGQEAGGGGGGGAERETERVVEKRWQKEETKGDRV